MVENAINPRTVDIVATSTRVMNGPSQQHYLALMSSARVRADAMDADPRLVPRPAVWS